MREDDETTAVQLFHLLKEEGHPLSLRTILRCRTSLGWTFRGSSYCQLIRQPNKEKRLQWALDNITDTFEDVVWTDETTVQLETHRRFCCRKKGEPPKSKPRYTYCGDALRYIYLHMLRIIMHNLKHFCPTLSWWCAVKIKHFVFLYRAKHPVKVHVWAGISWQGSTGVCIFEGLMNAPTYIKILERALLPFLFERLPDGHRFMQVK